MKMIGMFHFASTMCCCNSSPFMCGIRTSRIRHAVSCLSGDRKKDSADANLLALNPADRIKLSSDILSASSSSTIVMSAALFMAATSFHAADHLRLLEEDRGCRREKLYDVGINSYDFRVGIPSRSAILTSSAKDAAFIFSMT